LVFAQKAPRLLLEEWVSDQDAMLLLILNAQLTHPLPQVVLTSSNSNLGAFCAKPKDKEYLNHGT
jgi:hypothetical protein